MAILTLKIPILHIHWISRNPRFQLRLFAAEQVSMYVQYFKHRLGWVRTVWKIGIAMFFVHRSFIESQFKCVFNLRRCITLPDTVPIWDDKLKYESFCFRSYSNHLLNERENIVCFFIVVLVTGRYFTD